MKYLTLFLFSLFLFQVSYTQEVEVEVPPPDQEEVVSVEVEVELDEALAEDLAEESNAAGWVDLNIDDFNADEFSVQAKNFGVQWLISQMIGDSVISNSSSWDLTEISSIEGQRMNGVNYRIRGTYTNDDGDDFTGEFTINGFAIGPSFQILEASYEIEVGETEVEIHEDGTESSVGPALSAGLLIPVPLWSQQELEEENNWDGAWNFIDTSEASDGGSLESAVNDGVDVAIAQGLADGTLPEGSNWSLQSVNYIQEQIIEGTKYAFWVTLTDGDIQRANAAIYYVEDADGNEYVLSTGFWKIGAVSA